MNLFLFQLYELGSDGHIVVNDDRAKHVLNVLNVTVGSHIKAGLLNGKVGRAQIVDIEGETVTLLWESQNDPPPPLPCIVVMAMPRPKMMRRILQSVTTMGVKELHLINSWKVEKSYWQTPWLQPDHIQAQLRLGLAQCGDTRLPDVTTHQRFKPFVQDVLPGLCHGRKSLVAHPYDAQPCPVDIIDPSLVCIGPEGGFTDYEIELLATVGVEAASIGPRILRTETAIPAILSRLYPA